MNDEDEHDCGAEEPAVRPWSWMQLLAVTVNLFGNFAHSMWAFFDDIKDMAKAHVAVKDQARQAWSSLHSDLESLPTVDK